MDLVKESQNQAVRLSKADQRQRFQRAQKSYRAARQNGAVASIIIPAHNEESVIERCLSTLLRGTRQGEFEVIVVANNCNDRTVELASNFEGVKVLDIEPGGKSLALNAGDAEATVFPMARRSPRRSSSVTPPRRAPKKATRSRSS